MNKLIVSFARSLRVVFSFGVAALFGLMGVSSRAQPLPITIDMVTVGNPGNVADTTGYGAVSYEYRIGKFEITIGQYAAFLNAVATADPNSLFNTNMSSDQNVAGITRAGLSGAFNYTVTGPSGASPSGADSPSDRPITYVSWFDSARFTNWLANGQPTGAQGPMTTENGTYDLVNAPAGIAPPVNTTNPNTGAAPLYRIPTENEWYKAAYYKGQGTTDGYWAYATQSNVAPGNNLSVVLNQANYALGGSFSVTQSSFFSSSQNYLTNVGTFSASTSACGTLDQSGNVGEWTDLTGVALSSRGVRGGAWGDVAYGLSSSARPEFDASMKHDAFGFRLAAPVAVPEPSTYAMALAGLACGGYSMFRRRKRA